MKYKIAIIAGGDSGEYEISIKSAGVVKKHLDSAKFESYLVVIRGKDWFCKDIDGESFLVNKEDFTVNLPGRIAFI